MIVFVQLTTVGYDAGPFDLYTDADGYTTPFATGVTPATLITGVNYTVPDGATVIRIVSTGICTNQIDIPIILPTTTTTSTAAPITTSTTTTYNVTPCNLNGDPANNIVIDNFSYYTLELPGVEYQYGFMSVNWQTPPDPYPFPPTPPANPRSKGQRTGYSASSKLVFTFDTTAGGFGDIKILTYVNGVLQDTATYTSTYILNGNPVLTTSTINVPLTQCLYIRIENLVVDPNA